MFFSEILERVKIDMCVFMANPSKDYNVQQKIALHLSALSSPWRCPVLIHVQVFQLSPCRLFNKEIWCIVMKRKPSSKTFSRGLCPVYKLYLEEAKTNTLLKPDNSKKKFLIIMYFFLKNSGVEPRTRRWKVIFSLEYLVSGLFCATDSIDNVSYGSLLQTLELIANTVCPYWPVSLVLLDACALFDVAVFAV